MFFFFFKQKTAYEMRISDWSSDVCTSDLIDYGRIDVARPETGTAPDEGTTSGSNSMEQSGRALRLAAATVRRHLLSLAARALDVDISSLEVDDGLVQSRETNRSEEHTSELQSLMRISYAVFCLKKKKKAHQTPQLTCNND